MCEIFVKKCDVTCSWTPLSQTVTPSRTPSPLERDVLYGRPQSGKTGENWMLSRPTLHKNPMFYALLVCHFFFCISLRSKPIEVFSSFFSVFQFIVFHNVYRSQSSNRLMKKAGLDGRARSKPISVAISIATNSQKSNSSLCPVKRLYM